MVFREDPPSFVPALDDSGRSTVPWITIVGRATGRNLGDEALQDCANRIVHGFRESKPGPHHPDSSVRGSNVPGTDAPTSSVSDTDFPDSATPAPAASDSLNPPPDTPKSEREANSS